MPGPELRHLVAYLGLRSVAGIAGLLPLTWVIRVGELGGALFSLVGGRRRAMVARHARRIGVTEPDVRSHVASTFRAYGRYWAEALWLRPSNRQIVERGITHEGLDLVERARDEGSGMIYVLPHIGNWEFAGPLAESIGVQVVAVAENLANRRIRDWFVELRGRLGIEVVLATGGRQVMRDLDHAIDRKAAVALLSDRDLSGRGIEVEFFGEHTTLPAGPATLAIRTGAPIFPVAAYFRPDGGHHIVIRPPVPVDPDPDDRAAEIRAVTQRIARELETLVEAAPEQWHLLQPNWPSDRSAP